MTGEHDAAERRLSAFLDRSLSSGAAAGAGFSALQLGTLLTKRGDPASGKALLDWFAGNARDDGVMLWLSSALLGSAQADLQMGDGDAALDLVREARPIGVALDNPWTVARADQLLGRIAQAKGELGDAEDHHHRALAAAGRQGSCPDLAESLEALGGLAPSARAPPRRCGCWPRPTRCDRRWGPSGGLTSRRRSTRTAPCSRRPRHRRVRCRVDGGRSADGGRRGRLRGPGARRAGPARARLGQPHTRRAAGRRARGRGAHQQGDRREAVRQPRHGQGPPRPRLHEARRLDPSRARGGSHPPLGPASRLVASRSRGEAPCSTPSSSPRTARLPAGLRRVRGWSSHGSSTPTSTSSAPTPGRAIVRRRRTLLDGLTLSGVVPATTHAIPGEAAVCAVMILSSTEA